MVNKKEGNELGYGPCTSILLILDKLMSSYGLAPTPCLAHALNESQAVLFEATAARPMYPSLPDFLSGASRHDGLTW